LTTQQFPQIKISRSRPIRVKIPPFFVLFVAFCKIRPFPIKNPKSKSKNPFCHLPSKQMRLSACLPAPNYREYDKNRNGKDSKPSQEFNSSMKTNLRIVLTFLALASIAASAQQPPASWPITEPTLSQFTDFKSRLQAAIDTRELASIKALYQTNNVCDEELNSDLTRWQPMLGQDAATLLLYFKDLSTLPPESLEFWSAKAHRLTQHQVTHFALVRSGTAQLTVPLILADNKFLIVPSEKLTKNGSEPAPGPSHSQPVRPQTNPAPVSPGSGS
jgi:hypothetical protein